MFGWFLVPFQHLTLDYLRIDPAPPHFVIGALRLLLPRQTSMTLLQPLGLIPCSAFDSSCVVVSVSSGASGEAGLILSV